MPKPDSEKSRHVKSKPAPRTASARTSAQIIAMVPRQHAAPPNSAVATDARLATAPVSSAKSRRACVGPDTLLARATIAVAGFLLGALACYVLLEFRIGHVAAMSAGTTTTMVDAPAQHARAGLPSVSR